jgi:hypothetical protein
MYLYEPTDEGIAQLKALSQFQVGLDEMDSVLRYFIHMYDPNSDLRKTHADFTKRKIEAAKLAKFKTTRSGGMSEYVQTILLGKDVIANKLTMDYIKLFGSPWLLKYYSLWNLLDAELSASQDLTELGAKERETIRKNIKDLTGEISECENHLFGGIDAEALRNELFSSMQADRAVRLRPENMAVDLEQKKLSIGKNPFYPEIE